MRILHIGKFFPPHHGGMEVFLADLIAEQQAQGLEVAAIVHGGPLPDDPSWLTRVPVQVQLIYAPIALGFCSALDKAIKRFKPDILHLHMPNTSVFWALTLESARYIPWMVHWHSDVVVSKISRLLALAYKIYRPFAQAEFERAERITATPPPYLDASEPLAQWRYKCAVVPLGLAYSRAATDLDSSIDTLQWTTGRFRLLSIGRLTYYKGYEKLIRVVAGISDVELLIVGSGEPMSKLKELITALTPQGEAPRIQLLGALSERREHALLESRDAFYLVSVEWAEAFGMVLLEVKAYAKPCIVSELPGSGMPWIIKDVRAGLTTCTTMSEASMVYCSWSTCSRIRRGSFPTSRIGRTYSVMCPGAWCKAKRR